MTKLRLGFFIVLLTFIFNVFVNILVAADSVSVNDKKRPDENLDGYTQYQKPMGSVVDVNVMKKGTNVVIILTVTRSFMADVKILNYPYRLMIDIPMPYEWKVDEEALKNKIPVTLIQGFRYGNPAKNLFRIVADLGRPIDLRKAYIEKRNDNNYNFIIEMGGSTAANAVVSANSIVFSGDDTSVVREISKISEDQEQQAKIERNKQRVSYKVQDYLQNVTYTKPKNNFPDRKVVVFLDPGHGGKDPGAISSDGKIIEKNLVLDVALLIRGLLEQNPEISVVLSRDGDYYLPLKDRVLWAQAVNSVVFVSIHADKASGGDKSSGLSVYTLSDVASDNQTQVLATSENNSDTVAGVQLSASDEEVNKILISLSQRVKVNDSLVLAKEIVDVGTQRVKVLPNPLRSAGFAVLKVPNMPSVLVELGFLSNADDLLRFTSSGYKKDISNAFYIALENYLVSKGLVTKKTAR